MTTPIAIDDLAARAGYCEQAIRNARDVLVSRGLLRIVGGGRGRVASYELLELPGAGPDPSLPLLGRVRPPAPPELGERDLFEQPAEREVVRAYDVGTFYRRWVSNIGTKYRRWRTNIGTLYRRWYSKVGTFYRRWTSDLYPRARVTRDVHTFKNVHTRAAIPGEPTAQRGPPFAVVHHPWHAWCGLVCVPKKLHQAWLDKGHSQAWLFAFYARTCATVSAEQAKTVVDEYKFWRTALAAEFADQGTAARGALKSFTEPRQVDVPGATSCLHDPTCQASGGQSAWEVCRDRTIADARAERKQA